MPQPRSRKDVDCLSRGGGVGPSAADVIGGSSSVRSSRNWSSFVSASESSNQTVPRSVGSEELLTSSRLYRLSQLFVCEKKRWFLLAYGRVALWAGLWMAEGSILFLGA